MNKVVPEAKAGAKEGEDSKREPNRRSTRSSKEHANLFNSYGFKAKDKRKSVKKRASMKERSMKEERASVKESQKSVKESAPDSSSKERIGTQSTTNHFATYGRQVKLSKKSDRKAAAVEDQEKLIGDAPGAGYWFLGSIWRFPIPFGLMIVSVLAAPSGSIFMFHELFGNKIFTKEVLFPCFLLSQLGCCRRSSRFCSVSTGVFLYNLALKGRPPSLPYGHF